MKNLHIKINVCHTIICIAFLSVVFLLLFKVSCSLRSTFSDRLRQIYWCIDYNVFSTEMKGKPFSVCVNQIRTGIQKSVDINSIVSKEKIFINLYGLCVSYLDLYKPAPNRKDLIKLQNNHLCLLSDKPNLTEDNNISEMTYYAKELIKCQQYLSEQGITFLYVVVPHKIHKKISYLPGNIEDCGNDCYDLLLKEISGHVDYIDTRSIFLNTPEEHYCNFYKGDSHWKIYYAFLATKQIIEHLHQQSNIKINSYFQDIHNYIKYQSSTRTSNDISHINFGPFYYPSEKTEWIVPKSCPQIDVYSKYTGHEFEYHGKFDMDIISDICPELEIINKNAINNKKVMIVGDSFSPPVMSLLTLSFTHIKYHTLLPYKGDLFQDIKNFQPDYVIAIFTARNIAWDNITNKYYLYDLSPDKNNIFYKSDTSTYSTE